MVSKTGEYALRSMIYIAQHGKDRSISGKEIAAQSGIPSKYLSTVLGALVRAGVLESSRGVGGGFRMVRSAKKVELYEVLAPFEQFDNDRCPFGQQVCSDGDPCVGHEEWKRLKLAQRRFLERTTIHDVAFKKRKRQP